MSILLLGSIKKVEQRYRKTVLSDIRLNLIKETDITDIPIITLLFLPVWVLERVAEEITQKYALGGGVFKSRLRYGAYHPPEDR